MVSLRRRVCASNRPAEYAMLMAVSSLSPVSTQTRMPASRSFSIVSFTSSCKRSSTAVTPSSVSPHSISLYAAANYHTYYYYYNRTYQFLVIFHSAIPIPIPIPPLFNAAFQQSILSIPFSLLSFPISRYLISYLAMSCLKYPYFTSESLYFEKLKFQRR